MQRKMKVTVPARKVEKVVQELCDLCGFDMDKQHVRDGNPFGIYETEIVVRHGNSYPDGGDSKRHEVDLCVRCMLEKVLPWLESQGADVRVEESDW